MIATLAIALPSGALPTEFRLFVTGWNDTENGRFLFDKEAASATMAAYKKWGVDIAIDLEHQMLEADIAPDPTAKDARGWCKLELREDGSLWAVNVTWTTDGEARLVEKRQRYISPAFAIDPDTSRVTSILNVAITAIPATHNTPALIAANRIQTLAAGVGDAMTVEEFLKVIKALGIDESTSLEEAMAKIKGETPAEPEEVVVEPEVMAAEPAATAEEKEKPEEIAAASARLMRLSGKTSFVDAIAETEVWRTSHLTYETEMQKLAVERATLESAARRKLCIELVTLGAEFPSTVWADDKSTTLKSRWLEMPIAALVTHTAEQRAARSGKTKPALVPPAEGGASADGGKDVTTSTGVVVRLSARELAMCAEMKIELTDYATDKAALKKG